MDQLLHPTRFNSIPKRSQSERSWVGGEDATHRCGENQPRPGVMWERGSSREILALFIGWNPLPGLVLLGLKKARIHVLSTCGRSIQAGGGRQKTAQPLLLPGCSSDCYRLLPIRLPTTKSSIWGPNLVLRS